MKTTFMIAGLFFILAYAGLNETMGQWQFNGNNIFNTNAGFVGIGNSSPSSLLHVQKNTGEPAITIQNLGGGGGATYSMIDNLSGANWKFKATTFGGFKIRDHTNSLDVIVIEPNSFANALYITTANNIGIGTSAPNTSAILELNATDRGFLPPRLTTDQIIQIINPPAGLMVFNTNSGRLNFFNGTNWHELMQGNCVPMLTTADAGEDQFIQSNNSATLQANTPEYGTGLWTIISGVAGVLSDPEDPSSLFSSGLAVEDYTLRWTISNVCGISQDDVNISFLNLDTAIYVSISGIDSNPGTKSQPVRTIAHGITHALNEDKTDVNISAGVYDETVSLASSMHLHGGFNPSTWIRDITVNETTINGEAKAVIGTSVSDAMLDGLSVESSNATGVGASSYGVFLTNCPGVQIVSCSIISGNGSSGTSGAAGPSGANGNNGNSGQTGCENSVWPCAQCSLPQGGQGASSPIGSYGGTGGVPGLGSEFGYPGDPGGGQGYGAGGQGGALYNTSSCLGYKIPGYTANGVNGQDGINGNNGAGGSSIGTIAAGGFMTANGATGSLGNHGGGGGGGGGGPSIGIVKNTSGTVNQTGNTFLLGQGGSGGSSTGNAGQNGLVANTNF